MKKLKIIGSVLLIAVALAWLQRSLHPQPPAEQFMPAKGLGQVLAEQAAIAANDQGRAVFVYMPSGEIEGPAQLEGFQNALGQHKHITLTATKTINPMETASGKLTFNQYAAIINEYSNASVIVFAVGVTSFTGAQMATLPQPSPKLVVMDWKPGDADRGMEAGLVKAVVSTRRLTSVPTDHPKTSGQWFDRYYDLMTPH